MRIFTTQLINEVLKSLHSDPKSKDLFLVVRLNGLVHMDDHQALLEIVTQLGLEVEPGKMIQVCVAAVILAANACYMNNCASKFFPAILPF